MPKREREEALGEPLTKAAKKAAKVAAKAAKVLCAQRCRVQMSCEKRLGSVPEQGGKAMEALLWGGGGGKTVAA